MRKARSSTRPYLIPIVFVMLVAAVVYWQYRPSATIKATIPGVQEIRTIRVIEAIPSDAHIAPNEKEQIRDIATLQEKGHLDLAARAHLNLELTRMDFDLAAAGICH